MLSIKAIAALSDNYIWCLYNPETGDAVVVDPGQAEPVLDFLDQHRLTLDTILLTHHHPDHTAGVAALKKAASPQRVIGPADSPFTDVTETVRAGDRVSWQDLAFQVIAVPGHTLDHIAFYSDTHVDGYGVLFCGDALFVCGCGRLFEGTPAQARQSLARLRELPDSTAVYCGHEYTLANLRYARSLLPEDTALADFEAECQALRQADKPTPPSVLGREKQLNPFLRWQEPAVRTAAARHAEENGLPAATDDDLFAAIRHGKDNF